MCQMLQNLCKQSFSSESRMYRCTPAAALYPCGIPITLYRFFTLHNISDHISSLLHFLEATADLVHFMSNNVENIARTLCNSADSHGSHIIYKAHMLKAHTGRDLAAHFHSIHTYRQCVNSFRSDNSRHDRKFSKI